MSSTIRGSFDTVTTKIEKGINNAINYTKHEYITVGVSLLLIIYAGIIAPKLSLRTLKMFDNWIVQLVLFFLVVFLSIKNPTIALIASIAILVTLILATNKMSQSAESSTEGFYSKPLDQDFNYNDFEIDNDNEILKTINTQNDMKNVNGITSDYIDMDNEILSGKLEDIDNGTMTSIDGPQIELNKVEDYGNYDNIGFMGVVDDDDNLSNAPYTV